MPCFHPIRAYRVANKRDGSYEGVIFAELHDRYNVVGEIKLPCGSCIGCKLERARQWAVRCMHEASLYERNAFITLTFNDDNIPDGESLEYRPFQLFMKRLRKRFPKEKIRFFMCGEYGEKYGRPHYHACLFNFDFDDRVYLKTSPSGSKIYTSAILSSLWTNRRGDSLGFTTVGDVNFNSAGYVARYVVKKSLGYGEDEKYEYFDQETGEVLLKEKEFTRMSLKPGIGRGFYEKWKTDIFPQDSCIVNGKETKPPKYYYRILAKEDGFMHDDIAYLRERRAKASIEEDQERRNLAKEAVMEARLKFLKRELI